MADRPLVRSLQYSFAIEFQPSGYPEERDETQLYFVEKRHCDSFDKIMRVIVTLCHKPWATSQHIIQFSQVVAEELEISLD